MNVLYNNTNIILKKQKQFNTTLVERNPLSNDIDPNMLTITQIKKVLKERNIYHPSKMNVEELRALLSSVISCSSDNDSSNDNSDMSDCSSDVSYTSDIYDNSSDYSTSEVVYDNSYDGSTSDDIIFDTKSETDISEVCIQYKISLIVSINILC